MTDRRRVNDIDYNPVESVYDDSLVNLANLENTIDAESAPKRKRSRT